MELSFNEPKLKYPFPSWTEEHSKEILHYAKLIEETSEEDYVEQINLLSKQLVLIGKVSAEVTRAYKKVYVRRKLVKSQMYKQAPRWKEAESELAVEDLRELEAELYGDHKRWENAFESTKEKINALKWKQRIDIEDGSSKG